MLDCHCHLLDAPELSNLFHSLPESGIKNVYCNSVHSRQWPKLSLLAESYPEIIPFYGLHPWYLGETVDHDLEILADILGHKSSFCGEIGLDRLCETDFALQESVFRRQLDIACATKSFVAIHCVKAWGTLLEILPEYQGRISFMIHSFQGAREVMERLVALGGMISFSPRVMDSSQQKLQNVLRYTPLENILLETDFPSHDKMPGTSGAEYCRILTNLYTFVSHLHQIPVAELTHRVEKNGSICTY